MATMKKVMIYGGKGGLGSVLVNHFKSHGWWVCSVDLNHNDLADLNIVLQPNDDWTTQHDTVKTHMANSLGSDKLDTILNVAGGWAGGSAKSKELIQNCDLMWKQSVWSSVISASMASSYLKADGCVVLPGAKAALEGTPGMIGYGLAKAAVHQLVKSLAAPKSGLPETAVCLGMLPITLDTPMNRKFMPDADTSSWTSLEFVADLLLGWAEGRDRPANGSLVQLITAKNETSIQLA